MVTKCEAKCWRHGALLPSTTNHHRHLWAGIKNWKQVTLALTPRAFPQVELKSQEAQGLQQQRDQYLSHLQQYVAAYQQHVAAYQQLTSEKEALHKQVLLQTQLIDQLQHEEVQGKMAVEMARQELQETQVRGLLRPGP